MPEPATSTRFFRNISPRPRKDTDVIRPVLRLLPWVLVMAGCGWPAPPYDEPVIEKPLPYYDTAGRADANAGVARMIPISTPKGTFRVWTKRVGNNPTIKVLLLHGGPAATHEYFEAFDSYFPAAGVEYYYYDQLGS